MFTMLYLSLKTVDNLNTKFSKHSKLLTDMQILLNSFFLSSPLLLIRLQLLVNILEVDKIQTIMAHSNKLETVIYID